MGHIPEENTLHEYLALGLSISSYLECRAYFSAKVFKIPYVEFVCGICLFLEKNSIFPQFPVSSAHCNIVAVFITRILRSKTCL